MVEVAAPAATRGAAIAAEAPLGGAVVVEADTPAVAGELTAAGASAVSGVVAVSVGR